MAGLYSQLFLGSSALSAHRTGVSAAGHNIANVNTPGHARVENDLRSMNPLMGGVRSMGFRSSADIVLQARERRAEAEFGYASNLSVASRALEGSLALESGTVVDAISELFAGLTELSSNPTDIALREAAIGDVTSLTYEFNRAARTLEEAQTGADYRLASQASEASALAAEIAAANEVLRSQDDPALFDRRNEAARQLSSIVGGSAHIDTKGSMRFTLESGAVLADGDSSATIEAVPDSTNYGGHMRIDVVSGNQRTDVTGSSSQGRMGAELHMRDQVVTSMAADLDQLAFDLASEMNAVHRAHAGLDGVSGRDLFVAPTQVSGAALALTVDAAILADPGAIAARDPNLGVGDNAGLIALTNLSDAQVAGAGQSKTFSDEGLRILTDLGFTVQAATRSEEVATLRADSIAALRDSVMGVSVEEELTRLQAFQRASEASARVLSTVDGLLGTLIDRL